MNWNIFRSIQFNLHELAGAFGDIGTDFPLLVAMIAAAQLHAPSVLIVFGVLQIITGWVYKAPMPVQPLKAMATIVIAQKVVGAVLLGAGLAIGIIMLLLTVTGTLEKLAQIMPKAVVRGLQAGLGLSLCALACKEYIMADGVPGYLLALVAFVLVIVFAQHKTFPASLPVIFLGFLYAIFFKIDFQVFEIPLQVHLPVLHLPDYDAVLKGLVLLTLPQIPLSLGNSILATKQSFNDLFADRKPVTVSKIGFTYSVMNIVSPFFNGIPVCHGAGGMVGHYAFGGRTGGSVIIYGSLYLAMGLFAGESFGYITTLFPMPVLGVILFFEGLNLIFLIKDTANESKNFGIAALVAVLAFALPYGFIIAMLAGCALYYLPNTTKAWER